jgi:methionyl-tRNA formyltransferase
VPAVYRGTSLFAAAVLRRLADAGHAPALVVTRPDAPRGRGRKLSAPPVAEVAHELGIAVYQPEKVNEPEAVERIASFGIDRAMLCAYGALIKEPLLSRFGPILNVHPSLLPRWRGAAPVERAIMAGDAETGVSIMALTPGLDDGPVCAVGTTPIEDDDDFASLSARLEEIGATLLVQALTATPDFVEQPEDGITYAEKIVADDRTLDPGARPAAELERTVRALTPHIGARIALPQTSEYLGVRKAALASGFGLEPGEWRDDGGRLVIGTPEGALELLEVQPGGGKVMAADAYLRGRPL